MSSYTDANVGTDLLFSYIKELADRLNTLEGAMHAGEIPVSQYLPHRDSPPQRRESDEFSPPPSSENLPKKRLFTSGPGGEFNASFQQPRSHSGWTPAQEPPRHLPHPSPGYSPAQLPPVSLQLRDGNYAHNPNGLSPVPQWRTALEPARALLDGDAMQGQSHSERTPDWDDSVLDR